MSQIEQKIEGGSIIKQEKGDLHKYIKICFESKAMTIVANGKQLRWV